MKPKIIFFQLEKKQDKRGFLVEVSPPLKGRAKHFFLATLKPGQVRGKHYHKRKTEWVLVTKGEVLVTLTDIKTKESNHVTLVEYKPKLLEVLPKIEVKIENKTKRESAILAIFDDDFDPQEPDVWELEDLK